MDVLTYPERVYLFSALGGLTSHFAYFIHGEHHRQAFILLVLALLLPVLFFFILHHFGGLQAIEAVRTTVIASFSYFTSLWTSIILYRAFFHRLHSFPGPFLARISKLYHVTLLKNSDNYRQLDQLYRHYGDVVRIGPTELLIVKIEAVQKILGTGSRCIKSPAYDLTLPAVSLHSTREKAAHDRRRRIWEVGFSGKALRGYEERISRYAELLAFHVSASAGKPIDFSLWSMFFSFDFMGDLAFGKSFGMLKTGKMHPGLGQMLEGSAPVGTLAPLPWLFMLVAGIPGLASVLPALKAFNEFSQWCEEQVEQRKKLNIDNSDIMSQLIEASERTRNPTEARNWLTGDARLIVVAGSDTAAATIAYLFYYLASNRIHIEKLRKELDSLTSTDSPIPYKGLQEADCLNGMINETLRLHPPVASSLLRVTPPEGLQIGDVYIPGEVTVGIPIYCLQRLEEAYEKPNDFIPERWFSRPTMIKKKDAFIPFSIGPMGCIGKQLALMEIRAVVFLLVTQFDLHFAPGEDGRRLLEETKDHFTPHLAPFELIFEPRKIQVST